MDPTLAKKALQSGLNRLIAAEPDVTKYDTIVGDGDCGIGLKRGAEGSSPLSLFHIIALTVLSDPEALR